MSKVYPWKDPEEAIQLIRKYLRIYRVPQGLQDDYEGELLLLSLKSSYITPKWILWKINTLRRKTPHEYTLLTPVECREENTPPSIPESLLQLLERKDQEIIIKHFYLKKKVNEQKLQEALDHLSLFIKEREKRNG